MKREVCIEDNWEGGGGVVRKDGSIRINEANGFFVFDQSSG